GLGVGDADAAGDGGDGEVGGLEEPAGGLDPEGLDVGGRGHARLLAEAPGEVPGAHARPGGEGVDGEVGVEVVGQPAQDVDDRRRAGGLGEQLGAELGLAAGAADEHHEPAGDGVGELGAVVVLDEGEGEVGAGGDAGGGPHVAVAHVDAVGLDVDGG